MITKSTDFSLTPGSMGPIYLLIGSNGTFAILRKKIKFKTSFKDPFSVNPASFQYSEKIKGHITTID